MVLSVPSQKFSEMLNKYFCFFTKFEKMTRNIFRKCKKNITKLFDSLELDHFIINKKLVDLKSNGYSCLAG
jgi:hypothetical protein